MSDINEMNAGMRWYVAHTYSGYENKVKANLEKIVENRGVQHLIEEVRIPMEEIEEEAEENAPEEAEEGKAKKKKESKLLPAYVLIKMIMCDESWHIVRTITGVTGFVGPGSKPVPLTDEEVESLLGANIRKEEEIKFAIGDTVAISEGAFSGLSGTLTEISDDGTVTVVVSAVGRDMPIKASIREIKRVEE